MMKAKRIMRCLPACLLAASMLLPVSCVKEQVEAIQEEGDAIVAMTPAATRTFVDGNLNVLWNAGDEISVFKQSMANRRYAFKGKDGDASGTFKYVGGAEFSDELDYIYGLYPYDADAEIDDEGWMLVSVSPEQEYAENGFAKGANVMVAASEDNTLQFKNVCGYVVVKLYGADVNVKQVVFKSNDGEFLAGDVWVKADPEAAPELDFDGPGETVVTLTAAEPVALGETEEDATSFWFVLTPNTLEEGFTVTVLDEEGETLFEKVSEDPLEIQRNTVVHLKAAEIVTGTFIDLINEPLQWITQVPKPDNPDMWDENHRIYPTSYADIAYAEWTWNNFPEPIEYPEGYPQLDVNNYRVRVNRGIFDNDALVFTVPIERIPANSDLTLTFALRGGSWMPAYWTVEASFDGKNWMEMDVTGVNKEGITYVNYEDRDGTTQMAPLFITKKDSEHVYKATLSPMKDVTKKVFQFRIRVLLAKGITGTLLEAPTTNSNNHFSLAKYTYENVEYPGPRVFIAE